jgi:V8-like Glu-specific endopeptidase
MGAAVVCALAVVLAWALASRTSTALANVPASTVSSGVPQVGALYPDASTTTHNCTASVIHSSSGSLLVTAAHCVTGTGVGMIFAPEQHGTKSPLGRWRVTAAYVEPEWKQDQDPGSDLAFLRVAPRKINGHATVIERVTGAYRFGKTASANQRVEVTGYPAGSGNDPVTCTTRVYVTEDFPSFNCVGFVDGTSGSPWIVATRNGPEIVGIIGGLHQGGCYDYTSYSSPFRRAAVAAYARALRTSRGDVAPSPGGDGC